MIAGDKSGDPSVLDTTFVESLGYLHHETDSRHRKMMHQEVSGRFFFDNSIFPYKTEDSCYQDGEAAWKVAGKMKSYICCVQSPLEFPQSLGSNQMKPWIKLMAIEH